MKVSFKAMKTSLWKWTPLPLIQSMNPRRLSSLYSSIKRKMNCRSRGLSGPEQQDCHCVGIVCWGGLCDTGGVCYRGHHYLLSDWVKLYLPKYQHLWEFKSIFLEQIHWPFIIWQENYSNTVKPRNNGSEGTDCILPLLPKSAIAKMAKVSDEVKLVIISIQRGQYQSKRLQRVLSHCQNYPDNCKFDITTKCYTWCYKCYIH